MSSKPLELRPNQIGKILQTDYDIIFAAEGEFAVCLTAGQMQWILASSDYAGWVTRWSSSLGTEIDKNIIQSFQADLVRRIMEAVDACEDKSMFRLRQSPDNSCQLEQSIDGGQTWSLAFDYALCFQHQEENPPLTRYSDEYRDLETSFDGGETWVTTPDARQKSPLTNNIYKNNPDAACETSAQAVEYMKQFLDVDDEQLFLAIVTFIIDLVAIVLTGGVAIPLVVSLVQAFIQLGIEAFQTAMTAGEWEKFQENLFCHASEDGSWTIPAYYAIIDQLAEDHTGNAHFFLYQVLTSVGYVGLNNAGHLAYETTPDCASFACGDWCYEFDFVVDSGTWEAVVQGGGNFATYVSGQYWNSRDDVDQNPTPDAANRMVAIKREFSATNLTSISLNYNLVKGFYDNGGLVAVAIVVNDVTVASRSFDASVTGDNQTLEWEGNINATKVAVQVRSSRDISVPYSYGGTAQIPMVTMTGTGDNPFGTDNCV